MKRILALIGGVAAAIILSKLLIENVLGIRTDALIESWMGRAGTGSALLMIALLAADLFLPIPSSLIMVLNGAAFGVLWGSVFSLVGSVGGEWLGFELVRRYGRTASSRIAGDDELERLSRVFARHGAAVVVVTRALPVVMGAITLIVRLTVAPGATSFGRLKRWSVYQELFPWPPPALAKWTPSMMGTLP